MSQLEKDPINLMITGVGGQGNVLISRLVGKPLIEDGYQVTIGETYGASQRGGPVASHVRISKKMSYGAIIPAGQVDIIVGLEPVETLRMICLYGSPRTLVFTNTRPNYPMAVAVGDTDYPDLETLKKSINALSQKAWYLDASRIAIELGAPLLANMVMAGALIGAGLIPLGKDTFEQQLKMSFSAQVLGSNIKAFRAGVAQIESYASPA